MRSVADMDSGKLVLRLFTGGVIMAHGLQKLKGWYGGPGIEGTAGMMASMQMLPPKRNAWAVALAETVGGAGIALGAATPAATAAVTSAMLTAIRKVHWKNGFFNHEGGWEFNGLLIASAIAITADGPGKLSLDAAIGKSRWGAGWALAALAAGVAGSIGAVELARREVESSGAGDSDVSGSDSSGA